MGLIIDTSVLIKAERQGQRDPTAALPSDQEVGMSIITLSELLEGLHYAATPALLEKRRRFIDATRNAIPIVPFDLPVAQIHAKVRLDQRRKGKMVGAHDLIIAATAMSLGFDVLTFNAAEFRLVEGLGVVDAGETS